MQYFLCPEPTMLFSWGSEKDGAIFDNNGMWKGHTSWIVLLTNAKQKGIVCPHLIYTECLHSMTETNCLKDIETQCIDINTRYSVCERGSEEGHLGEGQGGKALMAQRGAVLSVDIS